MSPAFLWGSSRTPCPVTELKTLADFKKEHQTAPKDDHILFADAHEAHMTLTKLDLKFAHEQYNLLLEKYPDSETLQYNLDQINL